MTDADPTDCNGVLVVDASDQVIFTDEFSLALQANNLDASNAAHEVDGAISSLEQLVLDMKKQRIPAAIVRLEKILRERFQDALVFLQGQEKALLEIRIREAAIHFSSTKNLARVLLEGRQSDWRYRLRVRELIRPLDTVDERSLEEFLFILWPDRIHMRRRQK